jgi:arginine deiminase
LFKEYPLIELVRKIYTDDKFKEDRNTLLTNLQNKSCLVYKSDVNKFEATNKNEHIDNIITARKDDLISMYAEFSESTKIKDYTKKLIEDYLEKVEGINKKDKKLKALYEKHKEEIMRMQKVYGRLIYEKRGRSRLRNFMRSF